MTKKCVTHPGDAHLDDLLSVAVVLATDDGVKVVERREPTELELGDPQVVVVDVGGSHDPSKSNFDHHQIPRDEEAACALSLLVTRMMWKGESVYKAFGITKWFRVLKIADSKGPFQLAKEIGTTPDVVFELYSPLEETLLALFQGESEIQEGSLLFSLLRLVGERLIDDAVKALKRVKALDGLCRIVEVSGVPGYVLESEDTAGTETWRERNAPGTMFSVVHDNRGPGWTLYRYDDCPKIDFSLLKGKEEVTFAHPGGFIAKTAGREKVTLEQALQLVRAAISG